MRSTFQSKACAFSSTARFCPKPYLSQLRIYSRSITSNSSVSFCSYFTSTYSKMPPEGNKRPFPGKGGKWPKKRKLGKRERNMEGGCTKDEILMLDIAALMSKLELSVCGNGAGKSVPPAAVDSEQSSPREALAQCSGDADAVDLPDPGSEITVVVKALASNGEGLAVQQGLGEQSTLRTRVYIVGFTVPGDVARVRVFAHHETHSIADLVSVSTPSPSRDDSNVRCPYFGKCGGCQLQMLPYEAQLLHKRDVLANAFARFSRLEASQHVLPPVEPTVPSPLQYGYRTKLTPHFSLPQHQRKQNQKQTTMGMTLAKATPPLSATLPEPAQDSSEPAPSSSSTLHSCPAIGFMQAGRRVVLDIEDCPLATDVVRKGLQVERERVRRDIAQYRAGATLLLRESTMRVSKKSTRQTSSSSGSDRASAEPAAVLKPPANLPPGPVVVVGAEDAAIPYVEYKSCVTDPRATSREFVDDNVFLNPAGSFFQNNNSILPIVTEYVRKRIAGDRPIRFLIDAYCGSGLFTITLAELFTTPSSSDSSASVATGRVRRNSAATRQMPEYGSFGVDVSEEAIRYARDNARLSRLPAQACRFLHADADALFANVKHFDPDATAVVIDPPRKGCSGEFLRQLMEFGPRRVAYVSCNVNTQARDVGMLVRGKIDALDKDSGRRDRNATRQEAGIETASTMARYEVESIRGFDFFPQTSHVEGVVLLNRVH